MGFRVCGLRVCRFGVVVEVLCWSVLGSDIGRVFLQTNPRLFEGVVVC